jgi:hypothetical protein
MEFDISPDEMLLLLLFSVLWSLIFPLTTENHNGNNISSGEISKSITQKITTATTSRQGKS